MRLSLILACLASAVASVRADPFDRAVSDSTVLYISIENVARTTERYQESPLFALYSDPAMQAFLKRPLEAWAGEMQEMRAQDGINVEDIFRVLTGQIAVVFPEMSIDRRGEVTARPVVLADIGANGARVAELIKGVEAIALKDESLRRAEQQVHGVTVVHYVSDKDTPAAGPRCWYLDGSTLALAEEVGDLEAVLARKGKPDLPSLATNESYQRVRARLGARAEAVAYLNMKAVRKAMSEAGPRATAMAVMASGIDSVDAAGLQAALGRDGLTVNLYVSIPGEKTGMLKMFDTQNSALQPPRWVPDDVANVTTMSVDFPALLAEAKRIAKKVGQGGMIETAFEMVKGMGVDVEQDILGSLGNRVTVFSRLRPANDAEQLEMESFTPAMSIDIKDKVKLEGALDTLLRVAAAWGVRLEEEDVDGVKLRQYNAFFFQIGFAILPDRMLLGADLELIRELVRGHGKETNAVIDAEDYARAQTAVPGARVMMGFNRIGKGVRQSLLGALMQSNPGAVDMSRLPDSAVIEKYLDVAAMALVNEKGGLFGTYKLRFKPAASDDG